MDWLWLLLFVLSFLSMEAVAYLTHRYVMHGFLWAWHRSHHRVHGHWFERNDLFAIVFALPSVVALVLGYQLEDWSWLRPVGYGILGYGIFYVLFHDILVHQRLPLRFMPRSGYLRCMIDAHHAHHCKHSKQGCESFGFLIVSLRYSRRRQRKLTTQAPQTNSGTPPKQQRDL